MHRPRPLSDQYYQKLIAPRSSTPDDQRREFILNVILCGLALISLVADLTTVSNHLQGNNADQASSIVVVLGFSVFTFTLWWWSRRGHYRFASYVVLGLLWLGATQMLMTWSFELPATQLAFAILVVTASVLLTAKAALRFNLVLVAYVLVMTYLQVYRYLHPDHGWLNQNLQLGDGIGYISALLVITLVSWLANREIDRSLDRARRSEATLEAERDQLEVKVVERTRELERAQLLRVMELQRLAEFGRLSAGLLHDVASPLTVASLNIKELSHESQSLLVRQAMQSLHYIERFLESARKQLKAQGDINNFVVSSEIKQVISILKHRAREAGVTVELNPHGRFKLLGDPVKFSQIMANLIINAIESYEHAVTSEKRQQVSIRVKQDGGWTVITVTDHGKGLSDDQIGRIFDTFYSGQDKNGSNMGIGLATVKRLVTDDFRGKLKVTSSARNGTRFTVYLRSPRKVT
jgi:signal transduction histidine kinase